MDGHPHRCSTDFEQALPGGLLARRGVGVCVFITAGPSTKLFAGGGGEYWESTSPSGYVTAFAKAGVPTLGLEGGVGCNP
jgi:hypothetical protein